MGSGGSEKIGSAQKRLKKKAADHKVPKTTTNGKRRLVVTKETTKSVDFNSEGERKKKGEGEKRKTTTDPTQALDFG